MTEIINFAAGGFRFAKGVFPYAAGVAAQAGFAIERARLTRHLGIEDGFAAIAAHLRGLGRPLTAFCACELRSPAQMTSAQFATLNRAYVGTLKQWGLFADDTNAVARSNVCPEIAPPAQPGFFAFSYTVERPKARPSFVVAGSGEVPEGHADYGPHIVRRGDASAGALLEKAQWVLGEMERRLGVLGFSWADTTATQVYTVRNIHPFLADAIIARGAGHAGLTWHYTRPPIVELEYEMDCRAVHAEIVI